MPVAPNEERVHVLVAGINDGLRYSPGAAKTEKANLLKGRPQLAGRIEIVPAR